ncbi:ABC transporter permease family protein [Candidatus Darwinibacter acetoxidans]
MRLNKLLATGAKLVRFGLLVGIGFIILYPLLRQLSAAVMHPDDMYDLTVNWIPRQLTRLNFEVAWKMLDYPRALVNTVGVTVLLSTLELAATMIIGYGFARWRYPGSNLVFALVILSIVIPPQMVMVPLMWHNNNRTFHIKGEFIWHFSIKKSRRKIKQRNQTKKSQLREKLMSILLISISMVTIKTK